MPVILCYGDSNTWGYVPGTAARYPLAQRFTGVLAAELGNAALVIAEGLNSRTTVLDDPTRPGRNGLAYLLPCLESHAPLDLVILLLGTNDLKQRFGMSAYDVARNAAALVVAAQESLTGPDGAAPIVMLVSPPTIAAVSNTADQYEGAPEKSRALAKHYRAVAEETGAHFVDAAAVVTPSPKDGVHWDAPGHAALGKHIAEAARVLLEIKP